MRPMMFLTPLLTLATLIVINCYLAKRCAQCFRFLFPKVSTIPCFIALSALILLMILGFVRSLLPVPAWVRHTLAVISSYSMGFYAYLLMFTLLADVAVLICRLFKLVSPTSPSLRFISGITVIALTILTAGYGIFHAQQLKIVTYDVLLQEKALNSNLNLVLISDLHLGAVHSENRLDKMVKEINALEPDIICIAGDIFDNDYTAIKNPERAIKILKQLRSTHGVYACLGNHDSGTTFLQMQQFLTDCGIRVLNDTYITIPDELVLVGRLDPSPIGGFDNISRKDMSKVLAGADTSLPVIVMDHNPKNIEEYTNEVDLILSGHTHKGQIFPGSLFTNFLFTVDYGYYRKDTGSPHVIVTSGVGTWGMPMRVGTDCEIVQITMKGK